MTASATDPEVPGPDDPDFEILERYQAAVRAGDRRIQSQLLTEYPHLADLLKFVDQLENFAAPIHDQSLFVEQTLLTKAIPERNQTESRTDLDPDRTWTLPVEEADLFLEISEENQAEEIGQFFGRYQLLRQIGRGGMGIVYEARQLELNRVVALKRLLSGALASGEEVRRFYLEARSAGRLHHPGVVGIHEVGEVDGQHFFTMEYLSGGSLAQKLQSGPLDPQLAARYLSQIAQAVSYLHNQQLVHRDLKPSNILFDSQGHPQVSDFGLVKVFNDDQTKTNTGQILGTATYMSPEQARGAVHEIDARSDLYSLGAILYEMLTGRPPFREASPLETLLQVLEGEPTFPRQINKAVPAELELICLKCLEKNPDNRYQSAEELAMELQRFLQGDPLSTRSQDFRSKARSMARRYPALMAHLTALLLCSLLLFGRKFLSNQEYPHHWEIQGVLLLWIGLSWGLQAMLNRPRLEKWGRFCWSLADPAIYTLLVHLGEPPRGHLLCGYLLLIAASGLWLREKLVGAAMAMSLLGYFTLLTLHPEELYPPQHVAVVILQMLITGFVVGFQVKRLRILSSYFES